VKNKQKSRNSDINAVLQEEEAASAIAAQEDQEYLTKYLDLIEKEEKEAEASPNKEDGMIKSLRKIGNVS